MKQSFRDGFWKWCLKEVSLCIRFLQGAGEATVRSRSAAELEFARGERKILHAVDNFGRRPASIVQEQLINNPKMLRLWKKMDS